jgi:hypothetical protein
VPNTPECTFHQISSPRESNLFVIPLIVAFCTFVKDTHGFIGTADLHLQKVRLVVVARRTYRHGAIHVGPGGGASQNIIHLLALRYGFHRALASHGNRARVWASGAVERIAAISCIVMSRLSNLVLHTMGYEKSKRLETKNRTTVKIETISW